MDLIDNKTFQIFFLSCLLFATLIFCIALYSLRKKGVNIYSGKIQLMTALSVLPIAFLPIWLHPSVSIQFKVGLTIVAVAFGIANFYAVHHGGKAFRKHFGIETEEDLREKERDEKAKKGEKHP